jgi:uncharacterized protein (DUF305 family)
LALATAGDLILDVVRAADPSAAEAARAKLATFSAKAGTATFDAGGNASASQTATTKAATPEAFVKFEAMVLQSFIQTMLPKDNEAVYGAGMAGEMWQSMLAEQLGTTMAQRGGHYMAGEDKVPVQGVSADPEKPALDEQRLLSAALIHEIQRRAAHALDESHPLSDPESRQPQE